MMTPAHTKGRQRGGGDDDDDDESHPIEIRDLLRWGHLGTTITLAIFLFTQYETSSKARSDLQTSVAVLQESVRVLNDRNIRQDQELISAIDLLSKRLEVQRADIREMQREILEHFSNDNRRFKSGGIQ